MRLILLGPPGVGKGTQSQLLEKRLGAAHISTGDLLRRHRTDGTPLGKAAQSYMDQGSLVPDALIIDMVRDALAGRPNFLLDGFPRTVPQAVALDALLNDLGTTLDGVVLLEADRAALISRLSARWFNPRNGRTYNTITMPPKVVGVDDEDGGPLQQRLDDQEATVVHRLDVYEQQTMPLIEYYAKRGRLIRVSGLDDVETVYSHIVAGASSLSNVS